MKTKLLVIGLILSLGSYGQGFFGTHGGFPPSLALPYFLISSYTPSGGSEIVFTASLADARAACHQLTDHGVGATTSGYCTNIAFPKSGMSIYQSTDCDHVSNGIVVPTGLYLIEFLFPSSYRYQICYVITGVVQWVINCS